MPAACKYFTIILLLRGIFRMLQNLAFIVFGGGEGSLLYWGGGGGWGGILCWGTIAAYHIISTLVPCSTGLTCRVWGNLRSVVEKIETFVGALSLLCGPNYWNV